MTKKYKSRKLTLVDSFVMFLVLFFFLAIFPPLFRAARSGSYLAVCAKNLSEVGKSMILYADEYDGKFPRAGGPESMWAPYVKDFKAKDRFGAYGFDYNGSVGQASISSCYYLLVKHLKVDPEIFICPGDTGITEFNPADDGFGDVDLTALWDFGPTPAEHYSYAYHMPFCDYALTTSSEPGMAVAADRNPWIPSGINDARQTWNEFSPSYNPESIKLANSVIHMGYGQNVLFVDGHVSFEKNPLCGVNKDNIYTCSSRTSDIQKGRMPLLYSFDSPESETDSFLVNDSATYDKISQLQIKYTDSTKLKRTSIVPMLDSPMPMHNNVIWCSTFQMAWDKLKNDIIHEPVIVREAEVLSTRLNNAEFSPENLEEKSLYAIAGTVGQNIIEQIQREIKKRFNAEPVTSLNRFRKFDPATIVTFSYLDVDIGFKYPFHTNKEEFTFLDSTGEKTNVTSFRTIKKKSKAELYEQIDILFYNQNEETEDAEFALDLCKYTEPYQIVLTLVRPGVTLAETLESVEEKITEFKKNPHYEQLRKVRASFLGPKDKVIVPDVLFKLTHQFKELIDKSIGNKGYSDYRIIEALQMINFALSKTGVTIKSWSYFVQPPFTPPPPRNLYFDRPFLIYVKKRGLDTRPFFVMWVDNAELMNEFKVYIL